MRKAMGILHITAGALVIAVGILELIGRNRREY